LSPRAHGAAHASLGGRSRPCFFQVRPMLVLSSCMVCFHRQTAAMLPLIRLNWIKI
jgi:hypothetical protein